MAACHTSSITTAASARGRTIVFATHYLAEADAFAELRPRLLS